MDLLDLLIKSGLRTRTKNDLGEYPADEALKYKKYNMVVMLLNSKGLLTVKNYSGNENLLLKAA